MDHIQRAYRVMMRVDTWLDPVLVQWFKAPPGAKANKVFSPFISRRYLPDEEKENSGVGEQIAQDCAPCFTGWDWVRDHPPAPYKGQKWCGSERTIIGESDPALDPVLNVNDIGQVQCCYVGTYAITEGGQEEGGEMPDGKPLVTAEGGQQEGGEMALVVDIEGAGDTVTEGEGEVS